MIPKFDPNLQFYIIIAAFIVLAIFGLPVALRVWNDTRHGVVDETDSPEGLLTDLEAAFRSGQMTEEEYQRIQKSVDRVVAPTGYNDFSGFDDTVRYPPKPTRIDEMPESNENSKDDDLGLSAMDSGGPVHD